MDEQYTVRLVSPVASSELETVASRVSAATKIPTPQVEKLLSRGPGQLTKATTKDKAERLAKNLRSAGLEVEVYNTATGSAVTAATPVAEPPRPKRRPPPPPPPPPEEDDWDDEPVSSADEDFDDFDEGYDSSFDSSGDYGGQAYGSYNPTPPEESVSEVAEPQPKPIAGPNREKKSSKAPLIVALSLLVLLAAFAGLWFFAPDLLPQPVRDGVNSAVNSVATLVGLAPEEPAQPPPSPPVVDVPEETEIVTFPNLEDDTVTEVEVETLVETDDDDAAAVTDIPAADTPVEEIGQPVVPVPWPNILIAASNGTAQDINAFVAQGADVNAQDEFGQTPLIYAVNNTSEPTLQALLAAGADVNITTGAGWTVLMYAVRDGTEAMVRALLEAGADRNVVNNTGQTALDIAQAANRDAIVALLNQ